MYHAKRRCVHKVLKGGEIKAGDEITMLPLEKDRPFTAAIITLSDKGAAGGAGGIRVVH